MKHKPILTAKQAYDLAKNHSLVTKGMEIIGERISSIAKTGSTECYFDIDNSLVSLEHAGEIVNTLVGMGYEVAWVPSTRNESILKISWSNVSKSK